MEFSLDSALFFNGGLIPPLILACTSGISSPVDPLILINAVLSTGNYPLLPVAPLL